jgi:hypothetical protein
MTKSEILNQLTASREKFLAAIENLSEEEMTQPGINGEWSIKDILVHMTRWEAELVKLLWQASQGRRPTTIHFGKADVDEINLHWFEESRARPLELALQDYHGVRKQTIRRVKDLTEQALTDTNAYPWLDGQPLWEWIAGDSFEHETEHLNDIINWTLNRGANKR